jgi:hypothetical protein
MARVILDPKTGLWRIMDGRTRKPVITKSNHAVDLGGQRTQLDAFSLLRKFRRKQERLRGA